MLNSLGRLVWRIIAPLVCFISLISQAHAHETPWAGHYRYEAFYGLSAGGSAIVEVYDVMLYHSPGQDCVIAVQGFQRDETIPCKIKILSKQVLLRETATGNMLLRFEASTPMRTIWGKLPTLNGKIPRPGPHFIKIVPAAP